MLIRKIVFSAIYIALVIVLTMVPLNFGIASITLNTVVLAIATLHLGYWGAGTVSFAWGMMAWILSLVGGDPSGIFIYPDTALIPRLLVGLVLCLIYWIMHTKKLKLWKSIIIAKMTVILNTIFVTIFFFIHQSLFGFATISIPNLWVWIVAIYLNFFVELSITIVVVIAMYPIIKFFKKRFQDSKKDIY